MNISEYSIPNAFSNTAANQWDTFDWHNMQVRINEAMVGVDALAVHVAALDNIPNELNDAELLTGLRNFISEDVLRFQLTLLAPNLVTGDIIIVIHVPTGTTLARHVI